MESRKYFSSRITDLEELYKDNQNNIAVLEDLEEELSHRSTQRAGILQKAVQASLASADSPRIFNDAMDIDVRNVPTLREEAADYSAQAETQPEPPMAESILDWSKTLKTPIDENASPEAIQRPITNTPPDILDAWTVIEALSPQTYKKPNELVIGQGSVAYLTVGREPWVLGEKSRPKNNLYYLVYLGSVNIERATQKLLALYQDKRVERPSVRGNASLGVVILDRQGIPIPDTGLAISSFGWSYAMALQGNLHDLKHWEVAEKALKKGMEKLIYRQDKDGNALPFSLQQAQAAFDWLVTNCAISLDDTTPPNFAIRLYQPFKRGEPEPPLLNSFYLEDLQKVKRMTLSGDIGESLRRYLGISKPKQTLDILKNKEYIELALQPKYMPPARWPIRGGYPLVLLQQTAVNFTRQELVNEGLCSVNGPPGTGKTTLLRDIVSSVLVDRAKALHAFRNVDDAFEHAGQIKLGNGFVHLYKLHESLRGHEMLVASTNNKAVENISKELPLREQLADELGDLNYFKTVSDALCEGNNTWGLIAAVLGKSQNKSAFINKTWWDDNSGLRNYFLHISGQFTPDVDDDGNELIPEVIQHCDPPQSLGDAKARWAQARKSFADALAKVQHVTDTAQQAYAAYSELRKLKGEMEPLTIELEGKEVVKVELQKAALKIQASAKSLDEKILSEKNNERTSNSTKPGFFKRMFVRSAWRKWKSGHAEIAQRRAALEREKKELKKRAEENKSTSTKIEHEIDQLKAAIQSLLAKKKHLTDKIVSASDVCGGKLVTEELWGLSHPDRQLFAPNFTKESHRLRDVLFVDAIKLHKAFIDASSKQLRQNLGVYFHCLGGNSLPDDKKALLPHLWSSAFLLTPVMSTTFASVGRMLKEMPRESLGWLLIDEAGQATPQAAIGAVYRAKRMISVGDPLQIEPVVPLPTTLVEGLARYHGVDPYHWMGPDASVQTLSDKANRLGATIPRDLSEIRIGLPLLVHRRCEDPMFKISNRLAYNGFMVQATPSRESPITKLFARQTAWFDVRGSAQEKWCPEEGEHVAKMLLAHLAECSGNPEIFVISPFRIVADRMSQRMRAEIGRLEAYGIKDSEDWIKDNIGTVHTFQGKETTAVILLLGAPSPSQNGARAWATSNVNLLNVAVSRAKQNFYVVGNRDLWGDMGHMKLISRYIA